MAGGGRVNQRETLHNSQLVRKHNMNIWNDEWAGGLRQLERHSAHSILSLSFHVSYLRYVRQKPQRPTVEKLWGIVLTASTGKIRESVSGIKRKKPPIIGGVAGRVAEL